MLFASDIADRAEETLRALDEAIRQAEASGTRLSDEPLLSDVETTIMADLDKGVDEDLAIRQLREKIKAIESDLARQRSGDQPNSSEDTIRTLMDKHDELNKLKKELKQLEAASGVDPLSESADVDKLQKNYEQLIEDRNKMEKELFEIKQEHQEKMTNMRSIFEQQYLQNLDNQGATLSDTTLPLPVSKPVSSTSSAPAIQRIEEPKPDVPIDDLEEFLRKEKVLPNPQPSPAPSSPSPTSKFSGLLDDAPPAPEKKSPEKKTIESSMAGLQFMAPVESKPIIVRPQVLPFVKPKVTVSQPSIPVVTPPTRARAVTSPQDTYQPVLPESFLRSLTPAVEPAPPPPPIPVVASPSAPVPAPAPAPVPVATPSTFAPPPPVPVPTVEDPLLSVLNVNTVPPSVSEIPTTTSPQVVELPNPEIFDPEPALPPVIEPTIPAPVPSRSTFSEIDVVEPIAADDQSLFDILAKEPELAEDPTPSLVPTLPTISPEAALPPHSTTDFSIFDDSPEGIAPPLPTVPAEPPRPAPIVEPVKAPIAEAPAAPQYLPHQNDQLPPNLEFYDIPSLLPRKVSKDATEDRSTEASKSGTSLSVTEATSSPIVTIEDAMEPEPPVVTIQPVRKLPPRRKPPASTVLLEIETEVEFLAGGDPRPADYTEFYITNSGFTEIVLNSPELKEYMDKAITGKNISSYAELWARAHKYGYNYPGLSSKIRRALRKHGIHRVRTDANGKAKVRVSRELAANDQAPEHYLIGVAMLGKVGVVWSQPFYIQDHAGQGLPVLLEGQDALWLQ